MKDNEIRKLIRQEEYRQNNCLELIASENFASKEVKFTMSTCLTNKYAEGYPNKRYYGGCENIDKIEQLAIDRACKLFNCSFANVQPHSGSQANAAAYKALEKLLKEEGKLLLPTKKYRKMKILTMDLNSGSHLTHGSPVSFSSENYDFRFFKLGDTGKIDFSIVESAIKLYKPDVILSGYSAYPYSIDFSKFKELAIKYDCKFMVDMAHIAGLVAAGECMSPIPYADIVTTTTHKTLRGPRGGLILTNNEKLSKKINSAVFPYYQGGPLEHVIAAKAVCFKEALQPEFKEYIKQIKANTSAFTNRLKLLGATCSYSDNHLMWLDVKTTFGITGLTAQNRLEEINITTNKNMIPNDTESPSTTSGLRIGFAALTTRGCTIKMAEQIADIIYNYLKLYDYISLTSQENLFKTKVYKIIKKLGGI